MPIIDIAIVIAIIVSVVIGVKRGFVKEAISLASLLVAIWAALFFGPSVGVVAETWIQSDELQMWFGRALVFLVVLGFGGIVGWGVSKIVHMSPLGGMDKWAGSAFGAARGILLVAVAVLAGQFMDYDNQNWWHKSKTIPYVEEVADWIKVMAPQGLELLMPEKPLDDLSDLDFELPEEDEVEEIVDELTEEY
jgi:membrane protein required for colicin V production